ncbi:MAG: hypothetical protein RL180_1001 [Pseudomonadota bacterium]
MKAYAQQAWSGIRQIPWRSLSWLTAGLGLLALCFMIWVWLQLAARKTIEVAQPDEPMMVQPNQQLAGFNDTLGRLTDVVPVLDLSQKIVQVGTHAAEFRGAAFLTRESANWTVQLMNVSQESVITDYLTSRRDRTRFQYFRTINKEQERFVLTYGNFATVQTAMGALATIDFGLPQTVTPFPERFSSYQPYVSDQGSDERVVGAGAKRTHQVKLRTVATPVAQVPETAVPTRSESSEPAIGRLPSDANVSVSKEVMHPVEPRQPATVTPPEGGGLTDDEAVQDPFD